MNLNEVLQLVDRLVVERTGKHLDDVQRAVIEGTWHRQTYDDIAQQFNFNKNYVGDVGAALWQLLSEALSEEIKKSNFRSTIERLRLTESPVIIQNNNTNNSHSFNVCTQPSQNTNGSQENDQQLINHDLTFAPQIINFYNRETELENLSSWILDQNTRLISVLGLNGIGKTTLVKKTVDLNLEQFEIIIWKNLKFPKPLESILDEILASCHEEPQANISKKLEKISIILTKKKILIILDDVQNIFIPGELAGQYQTQYQDYQNWFKILTESQHQSSIILIGQEQCPEMHCLDEELYPIKCLELSGLESLDILDNKDLKDKEDWSTLIERYQGNPQHLQDIVTVIKDFFDHSVADFLAEDPLIISNQMRSQFKQQWNRLSPIEQQLAIELSKFEEPIIRETLKQNLALSSTEFINGLQSLEQRYWLIRIKGDKTFFKLSPVLKKYINTFIKDK
jgi:hypothetical protein